MSAGASHWSRRRVLGLGAAVASGVVLGGCGLSPGSQNGADDPDAGWAGSAIEPPFAKPDRTFTDLDGNPYPFRAKTDDRLTVLFFGYTSCPDVCPITLNTLARAIEAIGSGPGSRPIVVFVGVDLARDTPEAMGTYLQAIDPSFVGLLPAGDTPGQQRTMLAAALADLHESEPFFEEPDEDGDYVVGHPAAVYVFSPDGRAHRRFKGDMTRQRDWARDLPRLDQAPYR